MCSWICLQLLCETYLILRRTERVKTTNINWSSCRVLVILDTLKVSRGIFEEYQVSNFMKIHQVGAEMFHADGRTGGRTEILYEANSGFPQFCERV